MQLIIIKGSGTYIYRWAISIFFILLWCLLYIKEQRFRHTQHIYIINNAELNPEQHITQDHLQALVDTFLILKQSYVTCHCLELHITKI
jgi:hypothetical protein